MEKEFEVSEVTCGGHEVQAAIRLKEGDHEMLLCCSRGYNKVEFFYHDITKWEYPFGQEPLTENDRARLVAKIEDHYIKKGWDIVIDRRRFCPHCREILAGSQYDNWSGGVCDFCGKRIDRFGKLVIAPVTPEKGIFQKLKDFFV